MATKTQQNTKGKGAAAPPPKGNQQVARQASKAVGEHDPELLKMMAGDAGKGVSTDAADNIVPLIYKLQSNSPSLDRSNTTMFLGKDAKAGDIWFRGTKKFVPADQDEEDEGLIVVPCHFSKCWIEWRPDRGGFVGRHKDRPKEAVERLEKKEGSDSEKRVWRMPNGNSVQETREYVVAVLNVFDRPKFFVIPMTSTDHTPARAWMSLINEKVVPGTDKPAAIYSHRYRLTTVPKKNDDGSWYGFNVTDAHLEDDGSYSADLLDDIDIYKECKRVNDQFERGELKADVATDEHELDADTQSGEGGDDGDGM